VLDESKYEGYVGCEYRPANGTAAGLGWLYRLLDRRPARAGAP
jgi:hydroxypyruvate isomerase